VLGKSNSYIRRGVRKKIRNFERNANLLSTDGTSYPDKNRFNFEKKGMETNDGKKFLEGNTPNCNN